MALDSSYALSDSLSQILVAGRAKRSMLPNASLSFGLASMVFEFSSDHRVHRHPFGVLFGLAV